MKNLFYLLILLPMIFSCGDEKKSNDNQIEKSVQSIDKLDSSAIVLALMENLKKNVDNHFEEVRLLYQERTDLANYIIASISVDIEYGIMTDLENAKSIILNGTKPKEIEVAYQYVNNLIDELISKIQKEKSYDYQVKLEGGENKITYARKKYNEIARNYNSIINQSEQEFAEVEYFRAPKEVEVEIVF